MGILINSPKKNCSELIINRTLVSIGVHENTVIVIAIFIAIVLGVIGLKCISRTCFRPLTFV